MAGQIHPDEAARPSEYDRDHAWPYYSYIITSVSADKINETNSWLLKDDRSGYDLEEVVE